MHRTTIILPEGLKSKLTEEAERRNISFGELVRSALQKHLLSKQVAHQGDPFLDSRTFFSDTGPTDVAIRHDEYLGLINPHGESTPKK